MTQPHQPSDVSPPRQGLNKRETKRAEALRENLRKRKIQQQLQNSSSASSNKE